MSFVYAIAFDGDRFLMILNPKRGGWEMPGGRVEEGEDAETAVVREFKEETGQEFIPIAAIPYGYGAVFAGLLQITGDEGEMRWDLFDRLPKDLSFPVVEYISQVEWARKAMVDGLQAYRGKLKS